MGLIFNLFANLSGYSAIVLCSLSLTAGLYMMAELAEEYPRITGKILNFLIIFVMIMYIILYMDGLPIKESIIGILCQIAYISMLKKFPFIRLVSIQSFASVIAIIASHYFWLNYFLNLGEYRDNHSFQIVGFFVIMVWATPIGLLISLTINDNVIPYSSNDNVRSLETRKHATIFNAIFDNFYQAAGSFFSIFRSSSSHSNGSLQRTKKSY